MDPQPPQLHKTEPQSDPTINDTYLNATLNNANNFREIVRLTVQTHNQQSQSLLSDYGKYSLASLGGALTFLTVAPKLILTRPIFYVAVVLLIATVIITFITRSQLYTKLTKYLGDVELHHFKVSNKIDLFRQVSTGENLGAVKEVAIFDKVLDTNWLTNHGQDLAGFLFVIGFLLLACSLVFRVTT